MFGRDPPFEIAAGFIGESGKPLAAGHNGLPRKDVPNLLLLGLSHKRIAQAALRPTIRLHVPCRAFGQNASLCGRLDLRFLDQRVHKRAIGAGIIVVRRIEENGIVIGHRFGIAAQPGKGIGAIVKSWLAHGPENLRRLFEAALPVKCDALPIRIVQKMSGKPRLTKRKRQPSSVDDPPRMKVAAQSATARVIAIRERISYPPPE